MYVCVHVTLLYMTCRSEQQDKRLTQIHYVLKALCAHIYNGVGCLSTLLCKSFQREKATGSWRCTYVDGWPPDLQSTVPPSLFKFPTTPLLQGGKCFASPQLSHELNYILLTYCISTGIYKWAACTHLLIRIYM